MTKAHKIGLALGSGSARGLSHIGVIRGLERIGIVPDVIAGCSVGALVGASYMAGRLDSLESWALSIQESKMRQFFSLNFSSAGFVNHSRLNDLYSDIIGEHGTHFDHLGGRFAAVATDLSSGAEVWLKDGDVAEAINASMAFPGLFPAVMRENRWLVDGGLVNPVPVSLCRALGADIVIGVNLNVDIIQSFSTVTTTDANDASDANHATSSEQPLSESPEEAVDEDSADLDLWEKTRLRFQKTMQLISSDGSNVEEPKTLDMVSNSINIMQVHLTRSRLAGNPPTVLLAPRLSHIGLLELYKAQEAIEEGEACVQRMSDEIKFRCL